MRIRKEKKNINRKQVSKALNEERLWENWYDAKPIISKFNEYGGGPEDEEEWKYFVKKLGEEPTEWRNDLIMRIQKKHLKDDDAYYIAARYLDKVKHIYIDILDEKSTWEHRFSDLKTEFKKRPAFLEELKEYETKENIDIDD